MTLKIEAWQSRGIKQNRCVDKFEFCCWDDLKRWINNPNMLPHKCPECIKKAEVPKMSNTEVEKHKVKKEETEMRMNKEIEIEKLRHKHILEELNLMGKHKIQHFERRTVKYKDKKTTHKSGKNGIQH